MLTKEQKVVHVAKAVETIKKSKSVIFADFTGIPTADVRKLKIELRKIGATFQVVKKRLLGIAFKRAGITFDPMQFTSQMGTVFVPGEVTDAAGTVYKAHKDLAKAKKDFKLLGAYDLIGHSFISAEEFVTIAKLPSRDQLIAQVVGVMAGPIRAFLYTLQQIAKGKEQMVGTKQ